MRTIHCAYPKGYRDWCSWPLGRVAMQFMQEHLTAPLKNLRYGYIFYVLFLLKVALLILF